MDFTRQWDLYCERAAVGLWAEPLNALSNLAFFVVAYLLWRRDGRAGAGWAILVGLVGLGSVAFHLYATTWARLLDLLFIALFIYIFLAMYLRRGLALSWPKIVLALFGYALLEWLMGRVFAPDALNGSYRYLPALVLLALMSAFASRYTPAMARSLTIATCIFIVAVLLRTADLALCDAWPWGTHFLWHMLNAAVLYHAVAALRRRPL